MGIRRDPNTGAWVADGSSQSTTASTQSTQTTSTTSSNNPQGGIHRDPATGKWVENNPTPTNTTVSDILAEQAPTYSPAVQRLLEQQKKIEQSPAWGINPKKRDKLAVKGWEEIQRQIDAQLAYEASGGTGAKPNTPTFPKTGLTPAGSGSSGYVVGAKPSVQTPAETAKLSDDELLNLQNQKNTLMGKRQEAEVGLAMAYTPEMQESAQDYIDNINSQIASIDEQMAAMRQPQEEKKPIISTDPRARVDANTVVNVRNQLAEVNSKINELQTGVAMTAMSGVDTSETEAQIAQLEQKRDYLNGQLRRYEATLQPQFDFINQQIAELTNQYFAEDANNPGQTVQKNEIVLKLTALREMQDTLMKGLNISERPLIEWDGRQELVDEFKRLSRGVDNPVTARRLQEVRRLLEEGDTLAGNGVRSYSTGDRIGNVIGGAVRNIGSSFVNLFGTMADYQSRGAMEAMLSNPNLTEEDRKTLEAISAEENQVWGRVYSIADKLGADATESLDRAKRGLSEAGKAGVDIGENLIEMGFDAATAAMTGGGSLPTMFLRVFGSATQEARQSGASLDQQIGYGLTKAGIEVATEKMFDGVAKIYGKGAADEITEKLIGKLADTDTGRTLLRLIIGAQGEGVEEVVSDLLDPLAKSIYSDKSVAELYADVDPADILYSYLIGTTVGMLGGGTNIVTGGNAAANYELRQNEAVEAKVDNMLNPAWDVLTGANTADTANGTAPVEETAPAANPAVDALADTAAPVESPIAETPTANAIAEEETSGSVPTHGRTPAQQTLYEMDISDGAAPYDVRAIVMNPELKAEFERIAGVKIEGTPEQQNAIIQANAQKVGEYVDWKYAESAPTSETATPVVPAATPVAEAQETPADILASPVAEEAPTVDNPAAETASAEIDPAVQEEIDRLTATETENRNRAESLYDSARQAQSEGQSVRAKEKELRSQAEELQAEIRKTRDRLQTLQQNPDYVKAQNAVSEALDNFIRVQNKFSAEEFLTKFISGGFTEAELEATDNNATPEEIQAGKALEDARNARNAIGDKLGITALESRINALLHEADSLSKQADSVRDDWDNSRGIPAQRDYEEAVRLMQEANKLRDQADALRKQGTARNVSETAEESKPAQASGSENVANALAPTAEEETVEEPNPVVEALTEEKPTESPEESPKESPEESPKESPKEEPAREESEAKPEEDINTPAETEAEEPAPVQEASEEKTEAEEVSEEREYTNAQKKLGDLLGLGEEISNEEIDTILDNKSLRKAMESFGFTFENGTLSEQRQAVRDFAKKISEEGIPSEKAVAKMRQDADIQTDEQKLKYDLEQALEREQAAIEEGDIKARAAAQQKVNEIKETQKRKKALDRIKSLSQRLTDGVTNAKKTGKSIRNSVPLELADATIEFLQSVQNAMVDPEAKTQSAKRLADKFAKINEKYKGIKAAEERLAESGHGIVGREYSPEAQTLMDAAADILNSDTPLNQMSSQDLQTIVNALSAMNKAVRGERNVKIKGVQKLAWDWGNDIDTEIRENGTKAENIATNTRMELQRPRNFFRNLAGRVKASAAEGLYTLLNNGAKKTMEVKHKAHAFFNDLLAETSNYRSLRDEVTLKGLKTPDGDTVKISRGMMLSLYMHLLNEQNTKHISSGGITVADVSDYYHNRRGKGFGVGHERVFGVSQEASTLDYQLNAAEAKAKALQSAGQSTAEAEAEVNKIKGQLKDLEVKEFEHMVALQAEIEGKLTDYEKKFIAKTQEFMLWAQDQMNITSSDVLDILVATEDNYFPINSDPNFRKGFVDDALNGSPMSGRDFMDSLGITQQRVNASNPIRLYDITDVINNYTNQVSQYCGVLPALRSFNMVMNMSEAGYKGSLKDTIAGMYGENALKYINKLENDLQGRGKGSNGFIEKWIATSRGNFAASVLTLNARVAGSQFVSVFNAAPVLGWGNIAKAFTMKTGDPEIIAKYSPLLQERTNNKDTHKFSDNRLDLASQRDRITRKFWFALNWISDVDNAAIRRLWSASEAFVQQNSPDLEVGSEAYYQETARMFEEAVERTQPSYSVMQRSALQRSDSDITKSVFMFITQPMQNLNEVYDDIATASKYAKDLKAGKNGVTEEDVKAANKAAANSVTGLLVSAVALNALRGAVDMLMHRTRNYRDKETGELTAESFLLRLMDYTGETIVGTLPGGSAAYQAVKLLTNGGQYYGTSVAGIANVSDMAEDIVYAFRASEKKRPEAILKAAESVASVFTGMPIENAVKYVEGILNWVEDFQQNTFLESDYTYTTEQNKNQVYDALLDGNKEKADRAMERMGDNAKENVTAITKLHYDAGDIDYDTSKNMLIAAGYDNEEADAKVLEWYADGMYGKDRAEWEKDKDLAYDNSDLGRSLARAKDSPDFKGMDEEQQKKALDTIYKFYKHLSKKEYAEENDIDYENDTYEKFEDMSNPVEAILRSRLWNDAVKAEDYDAINALISSADDMSDEGREYFEGKNHVKKLEAASELEEPIYAKDYFDIHDIASEWAKNDTEKKQTGVDNRDYDAMDDVVQALIPLFTDDEGNVHDDTIDVFNGTYSHFDELIEAAQIGIDSKTWYEIRDEYVRLTNEDGRTGQLNHTDINNFIDTYPGLTAEQKALLKEHSTVFQTMAVQNNVYDKMVAGGADPDLAYDYYTKIAGLEPIGDSDDVTANQKAHVIMDDTNTPASQRVSILLETDGATIKPKQGDLARWLLQNFPESVAKSYWDKFKVKYNWKKSINRAKNSY